MWIYGALSQNQQGFAIKVKFWPDCGSLAPRGNNILAHAEAQRRRGAEVFRGYRTCGCGSLPQFLWPNICCYNCVIAAILGLFSQTNGWDRNRISLSPRYPMFATELRGVSSRCRQNLQPLPKHARPQLQIFDQMGQIHYQLVFGDSLDTRHHSVFAIQP